MALPHKVYLDNPQPLGNGQYSISLYFEDAQHAKYLRVGDYLEDQASNKYEIITWASYPSDYSDGIVITVKYVSIDESPLQDTTGNSSIYTPYQKDVVPPIQTNGSILTVSIYSGQNYEYAVTADWDSVLESNKAVIGDYISDSSGTLYEISYLNNSSKFSTSFRVKEVFKYGNPINTGLATLFRPTSNQKLFTGKYLTQNSSNFIQNIT